MFFQMKFYILTSVIIAKSFASIHFVKQSITTSKKLTCFLLYGSGAKVLIPHVENGQGDEILVKCFAETCCTFPNYWHLSHFQMTSTTSFYMVGHKYPARTTFPTNDRGHEWFPHIPSQTSRNTYIASFEFRHFRSGSEKPLLYNLLFKIVNLNNLTLTFLASDGSNGSIPSKARKVSIFTCNTRSNVHNITINKWWQYDILQRKVHHNIFITPS